MEPEVAPAPLLDDDCNDPTALRPGKDEMNFAEFPITLLTGRMPVDRGRIEYQDRIFDERTGLVVHRKLTIQPAEGLGLPTPTDDDVILALIQLTKAHNGFTSRRLEFSRLDLIRTLGWPNTGASYKRLTTSLKRWLGVSLIYENAWWDRRKKAWTTKGFHVIDNFELNDSRVGGGRADLCLSSVLWNQVVFESFEAGYLKSLDYGFYVKLGHPTARRLYRFLSKRMYHRPDWTFDLRDLAFEHVGLSRGYGGNAGKIKEKLRPAIEELEAAGFLEACGDGERYVKKGRTWKVRLVRKTPPPPTGSRTDTVPILTDPLVAELTARGVHQGTAAGLVGTHPADAVRHKLEVFDWLAAKSDKRVARNPAGYLIASIAKDYAEPKGFVSAAEQSRRQEARRDEARREDEEIRRRRREEAEERSKDRRDRAYWESLGPERQAALQAEADAEVDPAELARETGPLQRLGRQSRRMAAIRALLDGRGGAAEEVS